MIKIIQDIKEIGKKRLDICEKCPRYNPERKKCLECGCRMPMKVLLPMTKCPLGYW
jgi:hypothetical protein